MAGAPSKWNPKSWGLKTKIGVAVGVIAVIIAIIVGAYYGVRNNKYPNYSKLNYSLQKTCKTWTRHGLHMPYLVATSACLSMLTSWTDEGTTFFDDWDFYNTYDPTNGWVQYVFPLQFPPCRCALKTPMANLNVTAMSTMPLRYR